MAQHQGWGPAQGPGGPYGPYGWGGGWGGPPPAPKPGVIPLRPLSLGDILGGAFATFGRSLPTLLGISVLAYGAAIALAAGALALAYPTVEEQLRLLNDIPGDDMQWADVRPLVIAFVAVWLTAMLGLLLATAVVSAACPAVLREAVLGRTAPFGATLRRVASRLPAVLGTVLLSGLVVLLPVLLLMGIFAGIVVAMVTTSADAAWLFPVLVLAWLAVLPLAVWLWVRMSLAPAVAVLEGAGPVKALGRSARLVRGAWWRIFGITLLVNLMASVASYVIQIPFSLLGTFSMVPGSEDLGASPNPAEVLTAMGGLMLTALLGSLIGQLIVSLFPQLTLSLLYVDQRIRKEDLAPTLLEAAGPAPGDSP